MASLKPCLRLAIAVAAILLGAMPILEAAAKKPGVILRVWPLIGGSPDGGKAFRILYQSRGLKGEPI